MLYLLLAILKFLGCLLLWVVGILIVILLLILFVPIRYQFQGEYGQRVYGMFRCSWLCYLAIFQMSYKNNQIQYLFQVLGFTIYPKKKKKSKKIKKKKEHLEPIGHLTTEDKKVEDEQNEKNRAEITPEETKDTFDNFMDQNIHDTKSIEDREKNKIEEPEMDEIEEENPYFIKRIRMWIKNIFQGIKNRIKAVFFIIKNWNNKKEKIQRFIKNEKTKKAYKDCKYYVKKTIVHIIPRKLNGELRFGFEDPAKTGEFLSILSLALPFYKNNIRIVPYFDQTKFEGKLSGKGRVSIGVCLYIFCRVWFHKEIRLTIKRVKKLLK